MRFCCTVHTCGSLHNYIRTHKSFVRTTPPTAFIFCPCTTCSHVFDGNEKSLSMSGGSSLLGVPENKRYASMAVGASFPITSRFVSLTVVSGACKASEISDEHGWRTVQTKCGVLIMIGRTQKQGEGQAKSYYTKHNSNIIYY